MAYDQRQYQPPQRPYNGRAAQRPGPPQGYSQPPAPAQQYAPQQYDQYQQDGYGYDDYNNEYAQDGGYQDMNGGRGNGYPPQQEHYRNGRGGGMQPPRGGARGPPPMQRPPTADPARGQMQRPPTSDGVRGGYDPRGGQGRGYPNGGPVGRGGGQRPPMDRSGNSDPGLRGPPGQGMPVRKPLKTPPMSPEETAWDNPFPSFPGAKKKTSVSEERDILQKMQAMDMGNPQPQGRPRGNGSQGSQRGAPIDDYGRSSLDNQRRPPPNEYGRTSADSSRSGQGRGYPPPGPPQQGYPQDRRGAPAPNPGYGAPRQNGYGEPGFNDGYGPTSPVRDYGGPSRSMTMPNEAPAPMGRQGPMPMNGSGPNAPYNGPAGRGVPRPSTAGSNRPPPQRMYPDQASSVDPYANGGSNQAYDKQGRESVSDFYDSYFDETPSSEMSHFDVAPGPGNHRRGTSIDGHIQNPMPQRAFQQGKPMQLPPDGRHRAQSQAAVFEMAGDAPAIPSNGYPQGHFDDGYGNGYNQPPQPRYGGYDNPVQQNGFTPPPRSQSAAPGPGRGGPPRPMGGPPLGPRPGFDGFPVGPAPGGMVRTQTMPTDGLPSHPPPVRAGLMPNSVANQANNKPPPVRNYNNNSPAQQAPPPQSNGPPPTGAPGDAPPVTMAELEQLRVTIKNNPADQKAAMLLVRRLVEASDILTPLIPDQRLRNKARDKYIMDAHKLLKKLVTQQNPEAMFYLADCYGRGALGLETDNKEAFTLYQSAAKAGHAAAAYRTAVCCELGNEEGGGTRKDPLKAIQWYKRAAMLGDTPAMYKMGMIQLKGLLGQPKNPREAVGWLKRAAERADAENPHALHELGLLYEAPQTMDNSVVRDEAYSFSLFQQSADLGYKFSQFRLGAAYEYGLFNCPIDPRLSITWYSKAAAQEEHQSELALSGWYLTGSEGVLQQSDTEAYLWARKAAMAGLAKAEYAMGYFTEVGIGSPANLEDAKRWYWRAAAQNFPKARERLEDLKRGGGKAGMKARERISRSKVGKHNEGECSIM
ncbi:related to protoplast regeneration and killer toxin resistance protein [Rhynchosporium secalis]|uniref:Related to protoplast regeneration and killer toxin resistance protein n=1 Tax=Rhynchosporium secalis TaxID=38038 RepID=A0A1E1MPC3_RHYSE|nr:related to protoplast regeneration and killer toxin resistance protein [Rhynchosporium secalis]